LLMCTRHVEYRTVDYGNAQKVKMPDWECHQIYSIEHDSIDSVSVLKVESFPRKEYPGINMPWLQGDWTGYTVLKIVARMRSRDSVPFQLLVWDGSGDFVSENRYEKNFMMYRKQTLFEIPLVAGLFTVKGRKIDLRHLETVVICTGRNESTTVFQIEKVLLQ
jgi:hypothetical protein